jgi:hypothetical protein
MTMVRCARCSTWLTVEGCATSCLACHKQSKGSSCEAPQDPCQIPISKSDLRSNNSGSNVVQNKRWANLGPVQMLKKAWKDLMSGLFL